VGGAPCSTFHTAEVWCELLLLLLLLLPVMLPASWRHLLLGVRCANHVPLPLHARATAVRHDCRHMQPFAA
jgi:hypothetical protein